LRDNKSRITLGVAAASAPIDAQCRWHYDG
jgi:hypothetical protein